jgi:transposase InsO family protein
VDVARYVVDAVVIEGRSYRQVAAAHGVSKSWVAKCVARFRSGGYDAIRPRSRAPNRIPHRTPAVVEDEIVLCRKQLEELAVDAGPATIHYHLSQRGLSVPSVSTIWRILKRRGFITPQPHKRPRSSWNRFEASLPNECWQSDVTHWRLADEREVEICNVVDDYSRACVASRAFDVTTAPKVVEVFQQAGEQWGFPASVLTDNGCVYTAAYRGGSCAMETELLSRGIAFKHSRPYHPQTCGKVERFHQTLKKWLAKQPPAATVDELQGQLDRFVGYYNNVRPHRSRGRITPRAAFDGRDKARPMRPKIDIDGAMRVRHDRVDGDGKVTIRHRGKLHHIGVGRAHNRTRVIMLVAGLDIRVLSEAGELLGRLRLDPTRNYQRLEKT